MATKQDEFTPEDGDAQETPPVEEAPETETPPEDEGIPEENIESLKAQWEAKERELTKRAEDYRSQLINTATQAQRDAKLDEALTEIRLLRAERDGDSEQVEAIQQEYRQRQERLAQEDFTARNQQAYQEISGIAKEMGIDISNARGDERLKNVFLFVDRALGDNRNAPNPAFFDLAVEQAKIAQERDTLAKEKRQALDEVKKARQEANRASGMLDLANPAAAGSAVPSLSELDPTKMTAKQMKAMLEQVKENERAT